MSWLSILQHSEQGIYCSDVSPLHFSAKIPVRLIQYLEIEFLSVLFVKSWGNPWQKIHPRKYMRKFMREDPFSSSRMFCHGFSKNNKISRVSVNYTLKKSPIYHSGNLYRETTECVWKGQQIYHWHKVSSQDIQLQQRGDNKWFFTDNSHLSSVFSWTLISGTSTHEESQTFWLMACTQRHLIHVMVAQED